jgi:hypothetical protein
MPGYIMQQLTPWVYCACLRDLLTLPSCVVHARRKNWGIGGIGGSECRDAI